MADLSRAVDPSAVREPESWHDPMTRDAELLYLLSRHFPARLADLPDSLFDTMVARVRKGEYHSLSAATTILALDAYAASVESISAAGLGIRARFADGAGRTLPLPEGLMPLVEFPANARSLEFSASPNLRSYYLLDEAGFDVKPPTTAESNGMEVVREYLDGSARPVSAVRVGDEVTVRVKFRAVQREAFDDAVLVDLLPGGFDLVVPEAPPTEQAYYSASVEGDENTEGRGGDRCTCQFLLERPADFPRFADLREDRIVLYGRASPDIQTFTYRIKATNAGSYVIPPAHGESMYNPLVRARSASGRIEVQAR